MSHLAIRQSHLGVRVSEFEAESLQIRVALDRRQIDQVIVQAGEEEALLWQPMSVQAVCGRRLDPAQEIAEGHVFQPLIPADIF